MQKGNRSEQIRHYQDSAYISASPSEVFKFADDHARFSSHMVKSSWMMVGGKMDVWADEGKGQKVGSCIRLRGKILGINLFLEEVVTLREPPYRKVWQTVGDLNLLVIGHYKIGVEIKREYKDSRLKVFIDYELPKSLKTRWLGSLFGKLYARWCVNQMIKGASEYFADTKKGGDKL